MSNEIAIKNWRGKIIGFIETKPNGDKIIRNFYRVIKGRYDKKQNVTRDFRGNLIAQGDCLTMLLNLSEDIKNRKQQHEHRSK